MIESFVDGQPGSFPPRAAGLLTALADVVAGTCPEWDQSIRRVPLT